MYRLTKISKIAPKASKDIKKSIIGLGFEKLDRDVFDPEKSYDFVAKSGVKWARLQSGWQKTEKEKGVYDFEWLDSIVDKMLGMGVNYPIYKRMLENGKKKYAFEIMELAKEISEQE